VHEGFEEAVEQLAELPVLQDDARQWVLTHQLVEHLSIGGQVATPAKQQAYAEQTANMISTASYTM
jgi:hypothetical protein